MRSYKITFYTSTDILSNLFINECIKNLSPNDKIFIIVDKEKKRHLSYFENFTQLEEKLSKKIFDKVNKKGKLDKYLTFEQMNKYFSNIRVIYLNSNKKSERRNTLIKINTDILFTVRLKTILKKEDIKLSKFGVINIHSGILPEFRGVFSLLQAINKGWEKFGCSIHYIKDKTIDTGNLITKDFVPLDFSKSYMHNLLKMYLSISKNTKWIIKEFKKNKKIKCTKQNESISNYYTFPSINDISIFEKKNISILNNEDINQIFSFYL